MNAEIAWAEQSYVFRDAYGDSFTRPESGAVAEGDALPAGYNNDGLRNRLPRWPIVSLQYCSSIGSEVGCRRRRNRRR